MIRVSVRYTKKAQADASLMAKLRQPMALGEAMAQVVAGRVQRRGQLATAAKPYSSRTSSGSKRRPYTIGDAYAAELGLTQSRFRSSEEFHQQAGTRPGTYRVTGGMWSGLQVRNFGSSAVVIDFAGSTLGSARQSSRTKTGRARSKPVKVRNQEKAARVFNASRVNVIQPTDAEQEACGAAVARWSQQMVGRILGAEVGAFATSADPTMLQAILQRYDGSR
jgi:hypothetical protein